MRGIGLLCVAVLAGACTESGQEAETTPHEEQFTTADTSEAYASGAAAPVTPVQGGSSIGGVVTATGNLAGPNGAATGAVVVTENQARTGTLLKISLTQPPATGALEGTVFEGTCAQPGRVVHRLPQPIQTGSGPVNNVEAEVPLPVRSVLNGRHAFRVAPPGQATPTGGACADLPAVQ